MLNSSGKQSAGLIALTGIVLFLGIGFYVYTKQKPAPSDSEIVDPVKWYGYQEGVALGNKAGKKVFMFFRADWCTYCLKMEKETLQKKHIAAFLNEHFISIRVDSDKDPKVASEFHVSGVPTSWFLTDKSQKISSLPGYIPADRFLPILEYIATDSYQTMTFKAYLENT